MKQFPFNYIWFFVFCILLFLAGFLVGNKHGAVDYSTDDKLQSVIDSLNLDIEKQNDSIKQSRIREEVLLIRNDELESAIDSLRKKQPTIKHIYHEKYIEISGRLRGLPIDSIARVLAGQLAQGDSVRF